MIDDEQAIAQVLGGNRETFRILVERHAPALFRTVRSLIRDASECEDLVQDVFLAAYAHLRRYEPGRSSFSTWLQTIARNKCLNALKKKRPVLVTTLPDTADRRAPEVESIEEESFHLLNQALAALPLEQRTAFVLAEIQDLPLEEISKIEGVRLGTVKSRLSRAREKLRGAQIGRGATVMTPENEFESWKRRRRQGQVPPGFADRVMDALAQREDRRQAGWESILTRVLFSRPGKLGVCTLGALACAFRMISVAALFLTH